MEEENGIPVTTPVRRLCNEIQLFDLCDLESCNYKEGRFCTSQELIERFESIAEDDVRQADRYQDVEDDAVDGDDESDFGDGLDVVGYDDEGAWEDE